MENIRNIAAETGAMRILKRIDCAQALLERSRLHVALIGPANSGKTTLLNGIVGQELRKPSLLPDNGLPLRVCFDRMEEDARFDCIPVFSREWADSDIVFYELSSERLSDSECWTDVFDFVFYLMPVSHFMTADDKAAIAKLTPVPLQVIATRCNGLSDPEQALGFAAKACERMNLASPIAAGAEEWSAVAAAMRNVLPLILPLIDLRKTHQAAILKSCKDQIAAHIQDLIEKEKNNASTQRAAREARRDAERLAAATAARRCQETKLRCADASNVLAQEIRKSVAVFDSFAQQMIQQGRACKFDATFQQSFNAGAGKLTQDTFDAIRKSLSQKLERIVADAVSEGILLKDDFHFLDRFKQNPCPKTTHFVENTGNEASYLLQSVAGVGAVSLAMLLSPASAPTSLGVIAASAAVSGAGFFYRNSANRTTKNENAIRTWASGCVDELTRKLIPEIQKLFNDVAAAMRAPRTENAAESAASVESEKLRRLYELANSLST